MEPDIDKIVKNVAAIIVMFFLACLFCVCFGSCRSQRPDIDWNERLIDTVYISNLQRDSIHVHDSVYIREWMKGDTVYVDKEKYSVFYRDRVKHDSVYINKTDTIVKKEVKEVEKKLSALEQMKMHVGGICLWALLLFLLFQLWRWYKGK